MADLHILEKVWGEKQGYVFVPRWMITGTDAKGKPKGSWDEGRAFKWPDDKKALFARVTKSAQEGYEVYFCPLVFPQPYRRAYKELTREYIGPEKIDVLWADLDEADPEKVSPRPSIAWKTSDNRASALWLLDEAHDALKVQEVNKSVSYANGADRSGWDISQVLRVPGTANHKYEPAQDGKLLWAEFDSRVSLEAVATAIPKEKVEAMRVVGDSEEERLETLRTLLKKHKVRAHTKELLLIPDGVAAKGERSERLWELEKLLIEDGLSVREALEMVKLTAWNKFKGRKDEDVQLLRDLLKAEEEYRASHRKESAPLPVRRVGSSANEDTNDGIEEDGGEADEAAWLTTYDKFVGASLKPPTWIVERIWQQGYGMIAGEPKTFKSVTATDLALSVASGRPFLGKFKVMETGPVVYIQRENSEATVQDRILKIAAQKGLIRPGEVALPPNLDFYLGNNYPVDLLDDRWRGRIEATVKKVRPKLLILDPLYMMIGSADENSSSEMNSILVWLTSLRDNYGCYSLIVHHYKKNSEGRGGQRIRGTSAFHGWVETGLYLSLAGENNTVRMDREFRSMSMMNPMKIKYMMGLPGTWEYKPLVIEEDTGSVVVDSKKEEILTLLAAGTELTADEIKAAINVDMPKARQWLKELRDERRIETKRYASGMRYRLAEEEKIRGGRKQRKGPDEDQEDEFDVG